MHYEVKQSLESKYDYFFRCLAMSTHDTLMITVEEKNQTGGVAGTLGGLLVIGVELPPIGC